MTTTLYRAANDGLIAGCASFAESRETAEEYLSNPGFGGASLWVAEIDVDDAELLDLSEMDADDAIAAICELTGLPTPGAIGPDEWVPRISYQIREAGIEWVKVRESYPEDTVTWIFVGTDDPELIEAE